MGKPRITYWFQGDAYSKIEFDGGANCDGTQLYIEGGGNDVYDKHIKGTWGYGYCYKSVIGSKAWFYIRSYKKAGGQYFYSPWVKMTL